jgi:DNA anti-recombination protein RmuC
VIVLGLKGLQIEQHAQDVMAYVAQLAKDFERFRDDFGVIGTHIANAQKKYGEADKRLERFETQLERAADWDEPEAIEVAEAHELPRAVDAA